MAPTRTPLFLLGVGLIGGSLLVSLLETQQYDITALVRREEQAEVLRNMGVKPLLGSLDDDEVIVEATLANDVIIHTATADHEPSVKSILTGLNRRPSSSPPAVFIHTSGTGVLVDPSDGSGNNPTTKYYIDTKPEEIDALPDDAPHRNVDLLIKRAVEEGRLGEARVAIILPPLIFGIGTGPFNRISMQVPDWVRRSIAAKQVEVIGSGISTRSHIHVANLILAYRTVLAHLSDPSTSPTTSSSTLYFFAETGHHTWLDLGLAIHEALFKRDLVEGDLKLNGAPGPLGTNARSGAKRLRELGWEPMEKTTVFESVDAEVEEILTLM